MSKNLQGTCYVEWGCGESKRVSITAVTSPSHRHTHPQAGSPKLTTGTVTSPQLLQ